jgi:perosamine synthetase
MEHASDRDAAVKKLNEAGIGTGVFYPIPAYRQAHLVAMGFGYLSLPVTECMVNEVISLPVHPLLSQMDLETIVEGVNKL